MHNTIYKRAYEQTTFVLGTQKSSFVLLTDPVFSSNSSYI